MSREKRKKTIKEKEEIKDRCTCTEKQHLDKICPFSWGKYKEEMICNCCPFCYNNCASDV